MSKTTRRSSGEFVFANTVTFADPSTIITTTDLTTGDPVITVNSGNTSVPGSGAGLEVATTGTNPSILYTSAAGGTWSFTEAASIDFNSASIQNFSISSLTNLTVTNLSSGNASLTGGYIDGTPIGANVSATGTFTDLTATGTVNLGSFTGTNFTGNVTGNIVAQDSTLIIDHVAKTVTGDVTGDVDGDITGDVKSTNGTIVLDNGTDGTDAFFRGNIKNSTGTATVLNVTTATPVFTGDVTGQVSDISNHDTGDLTEGSNLYYTDTRVDDRIANLSIASFNDVDLTSVTANSILLYNSSNSRFEVSSIGQAVAQLVTDDDAGTTTELTNMTTEVASGLSAPITIIAGTNTVNIQALIRYQTKTISASTEIQVRLYRNSTQIAEETITETSTSYVTRLTSFNVYDVPGAGTHTYSVRYYASTTDARLTPNPVLGTGTASTNKISLTELVVQSQILTEVVQDTSPELGGTLTNPSNYNINMGGTGTVINVPNPSNPTDVANKQWVEAQVATANELSELTDVSIGTPSNGDVLKYNTGTSRWEAGTDTDTGLLNIVEDTTPQLGGDLDLNSQNITGTGDINTTGNAEFSGNLTVQGNLTINGDTTTIDVTQLEVDDPMVYLNRNAGGSSNNSLDSGILIERGSTEDHAGMIWQESTDRFKFLTSSSITSSTTVVTNITLADIEAATAHVTATTAQYADLAELYVTDEEYETGTVLVFGGSAEVTQSTKAMDHRIAGVVSHEPAYLMNSDQKGKTVAVALRGRVPVSIIGPVKKGDLIVTSDIPGVGQAYAGVTNCVYVIGKAIEDDETENLVRLITCLV